MQNFSVVLCHVEITEILRAKHKTRPTSMKSKAQMSRFRNWVNHMMRPCAFVVKLQADSDIEPISGLASLYPGLGLY